MESPALQSPTDNNHSNITPASVQCHSRQENTHGWWWSWLRRFPSFMERLVKIVGIFQCHPRQENTYDWKMLVPVKPYMKWKKTHVWQFSSLDKSFVDLHNCKVIGVGGPRPPRVWNLCCGIKTALNHFTFSRGNFLEKILCRPFNNFLAKGYFCWIFVGSARCPFNNSLWHFHHHGCRGLSLPGLLLRLIWSTIDTRPLGNTAMIYKSGELGNQWPLSNNKSMVNNMSSPHTVFLGGGTEWS